MARLFKNVPVLDTGARGATTTFAQRKIGDVFLSWENEAYLIEKEFPGQTEIVYPSLSILAEPPVAVVEKNAAKHGTTAGGQSLSGIPLHRRRRRTSPASTSTARATRRSPPSYADQLPAIPLVTIDADFGGWATAQKTHFDDGGTFDQIYRAK